LVAGFFPALLGPTFQSWREADAPGAAVRHVVPVAGSPSDAQAGDADRADASRVALEEGGVRVQVVKVSVETVPESAGNAAAGDYLLIRVRTMRVQSGPEFAAARGKLPARRDVTQLPRLTDGAGSEYALHDLPGVSAVDANTSSRFPVSFVDEVFAFDAPRPGATFLNLEVPSLLPGAARPFRFQVPAAMFQKAPAAPPTGTFRPRGR
jgi:hypothetical protein